jgi:hypothetical protein
MLAIVIEQIDVMAGQRAAQTSAHFIGKNLIAQTLGLPNLIQMARPTDPDAVRSQRGERTLGKGWAVIGLTGDVNGRQG